MLWRACGFYCVRWRRQTGGSVIRGVGEISSSILAGEGKGGGGGLVIVSRGGGKHGRGRQTNIFGGEKRQTGSTPTQPAKPTTKHSRAIVEITALRAPSPPPNPPEISGQRQRRKTKGPGRHRFSLGDSCPLPVHLSSGITTIREPTGMYGIAQRNRPRAVGSLGRAIAVQLGSALAASSEWVRQDI